MTDKDIKLTVDEFGEIDKADSSKSTIKRFTWTSKNMTVQVINYGATITSIKVPDKYGKKADIVMGFDNIEGYRLKNNPYFGATIGRCANRIKNATFQIEGKKYNLTANVGSNHLHGGMIGFDKVIWDSYVSGRKVIFSHMSMPGDEGYPGGVLAQVTYEVLNNRIDIHMSAKTTQPTVINMTNHSYFNLGGHDAGPVQMYAHVFTINAKEYTPLDSELTTTGEIKPIKDLGIEQDLSMPNSLHDFMPHDGFDTNFCIENADSTIKLMSKVLHPISGRIMEIHSDQPGVQFYTSNFLPKPENEPLIGKGGASYLRHGAFCLEPQNYPNAVNHKNFPSSVINPDQEYIHNISMRFDVEKKS